MDSLEQFQDQFQKYLADPENNSMHPIDIGRFLKSLYAVSEEEFKKAILVLPVKFLGPVLLELPPKLQNEAFGFLNHEKLAKATGVLESDDATDLVQELINDDASKAHQVISKLKSDDREDINALRQYTEDQAGSIMQVEVLSATTNETIRTIIGRLADSKLQNIYQVFIIEKTGVLLASAALSELITLNFDTSFGDLVKGRETPKHYQINEFASIEEVVKLFEDYDLLTYCPVVNAKGKLLGRITSDDIFDQIEVLATEQIYNLAGVDDQAEEKELKETFQKRASWLSLNLLTAIFASLVIGLFDDTLRAYIPLAILMPIVASMGGNAGTQSLTVMVRKLALEEVTRDDAYHSIKKEVLLSLLNGFLFALVMGLISFLWFSSFKLVIVIGLALIINLFIAGVFGTIIPLLLKKMNSDPAVGSAVIITTMTDVVGFFAFLGLAKVILV
jgi:magnesium transporter